MQIENELQEIFKENANCVSWNGNEHVIAMTGERFENVVLKILALGKQKPLAENKQTNEICEVALGTRCKDPIPDYKTGICKNCLGQSN